jgi:hypothetical protein
MEMDIEKKILPFATMTVAAACPAALALTQEQPRHASAGTPAPTGEVLAQRTRVSFAPRPSEQASELNVMDPIRESLGCLGHARGRPPILRRRSREQSRVPITVAALTCRSSVSPHNPICWAVGGPPRIVTK